MDDFLKQLKGLKIPGGSIAAVLVVLAIVFGSSAVFTIETGSVGVIQRFGKFVRIAPPGLNFKLPFGFESVTKVSQERLKKRSSDSGRNQSEEVQRFQAPRNPLPHP